MPARASFCASGEAMHKVHLRPASNLYAYQKLVAELESSNQEPIVSVSPGGSEDETEIEGQAASIDDLRDR